MTTNTPAMTQFSTNDLPVNMTETTSTKMDMCAICLDQFYLKQVRYPFFLKMLKDRLYLMHWIFFPFGSGFEHQNVKKDNMSMSK